MVRSIHHESVYVKREKGREGGRERASKTVIEGGGGERGVGGGRALRVHTLTL